MFSNLQAAILACVTDPTNLRFTSALRLISRGVITATFTSESREVYLKFTQELPSTSDRMPRSRYAAEITAYQKLQYRRQET